MYFTTNNLNKTSSIKGIVLPQDIWLYGGHYCIEMFEGTECYILKETNEQAFKKIQKDFGYFGIESFQNMEYKKIIRLNDFVNYLLTSKDSVFIRQYSRYLIKEHRAKFECYKKVFENKLSEREIENRFKILPYIKPYYQTAKNYILRDYIKYERFPKGARNERS